MSRTLHTDPYRIRASRRHPPVARIAVGGAPARPGFHHPAGAADVARVLRRFGAAAVYGLRRVELRQRRPGGPAVAELRVPGIVVLYEQPDTPWTLPGRLAAASAERLVRAGAVVTAGAGATRVDWPGATLRDFMLFDGLMHEIGHHVIQHAANKPATRVMRTADHERRADAYSRQCRAEW